PARAPAARVPRRTGRRRRRPRRQSLPTRSTLHHPPRAAPTRHRMKRSWNTLSQLTNGTYAEQDFERAAWRLVTEQVLYATDHRSRVAYHLVEAFLDDFAAALAPLGIRLERNAGHRYIVALPRHGDGPPVRLDGTLFLLILRQRYDEAMRQGRIEEHGEVVVELPDLQEAWPALTGRPMPETGALRMLAGTLRRWGCCRLVEGESDDL